MDESNLIDLLIPIVKQYPKATIALLTIGIPVLVIGVVSGQWTEGEATTVRGKALVRLGQKVGFVLKGLVRDVYEAATNKPYRSLPPADGSGGQGDGPSDANGYVDEEADSMSTKEKTS